MEIHDGTCGSIATRSSFTRPAVDPQFRPEAAAYGNRTVGVLLSGSGGDGIAGPRAIDAVGGISLVQDPAEAP